MARISSAILGDVERVPFGSYGPVLVLEDDDEIRVGYYDDDEWECEDGADDDESGQRLAIVYFCEPPFLFDSHYELIPPARLISVHTPALFRRQSQLAQKLVEANSNGDTSEQFNPIGSYRLLLEHSFVNGLLTDRMLHARTRQGDRGGRRVFISHSSTDKRVAISLAVDLADQGHVPWLDEWEIKVGESIPLKISDGLEQSDYAMVLMSRVAVESGWVQAEWTAKYWDEVRTRKVHVIPALLEDCQIPTLLKSKKYADFRSSYGDGLHAILRAIV